MKKFFSVTEDHYVFEIFDITSLLTVLNVALVLAGFHYAPVIGILNCLIFIALNVKTRAHINGYITQFALVILNCYFLTL